MNGVVMPSLRKQSKDLDLDKDELDFDCIFGINGHLFEVSNIISAAKAARASGHIAPVACNAQDRRVISSKKNSSNLVFFDEHFF